jgi:hypothetical protein
MMRKIFIASAVAAVLCTPAISVSPALGHEFYGDTPFVLTANSETTQTFQLGSSDWIECSKLELTDSPESGPSPKLLLKMEKYTTCIYNHPSVSELVKTSTSGCALTLKSSPLKETFPLVEFAEGTLGLECSLRFKTTNCEIKIKEHTPLSEFGWENTDTVLGEYASVLFFRLKGMSYEVTTGCGSNGTNGEYHGSIPLQGVIIK